MEEISVHFSEIQSASINRLKCRTPPCRNASVEALILFWISADLLGQNVGKGWKQRTQLTLSTKETLIVRFPIFLFLRRAQTERTR